MKCLLVFFFAGFFLAETAPEVRKYELSLKAENKRFTGKVKLTLDNLNNTEDVSLNQYKYNVTKCIYTGVKTQSSSDDTTISNLDEGSYEDCTSNSSLASSSPNSAPNPNEQSSERNCTFENGKIKFNGKRTTKEVVLEFEGDCDSEDLSLHGNESVGWVYVADMTKDGNKIIFPCQKEVKAELVFEGDGVVMSNVEKIKDEKNMVSLRDVVFVGGDIVKRNESNLNLTYYCMKESNKMGPKLKSVMQKVAELKVSQQILFTPYEIKTSSRDVIFLRDVLQADDSKSDYWNITLKLTRELLKRSPNVNNSFFDMFGSLFVASKISGSHHVEELVKFNKIHELEEDGFNNSKSLNDNGKILSKGISVLYTLESICKDENFTTGLSSYIMNGNYTVEEAFKVCFKDEAETRQFFQTWVDEPGYPVVHVILNKTAQYIMNQERFLWFGSEQKDQRWVLSIDYKTKEDSDKNIRLPASKDNVSEEINSTYIILNHNYKGFYRVNYDAKVWEALITQLKSNHTHINPLSRMQMIDDVFSFPKSLYKFNHATPDYVTALKLSDYLRKESDLFALQAAFKAFDFLDSALDSSYHGKFTDHVRGILNGIYNKIKNETRSNPYEKYIQNQAITLACKYGVEECIKDATGIFKNIQRNATELSERERNAICSAVRNDTAKWMVSFALLATTNLEPDEKIELLACSRDKTILTLFLTQFISQNNEGGFKMAAISAMKRNPDNIKVILDIIEPLRATITKLWKNESLEEIVKFTLPKLNLETANTLKKFKTDLKPELQDEVDRACANIKLWTDTKAKTFGEYFKGSGSQAKPIALVLLLTTLVPLANHIFHN